MKKRVGIPRALLYYKFGAMWKTFFEELGAEVIISPDRERYNMIDGQSLGIDESFSSPCALKTSLGTHQILEEYLGIMHISFLLRTDI